MGPKNYTWRIVILKNNWLNLVNRYGDRKSPIRIRLFSTPSKWPNLLHDLQVVGGYTNWDDPPSRRPLDYSENILLTDGGGQESLQSRSSLFDSWSVEKLQDGPLPKL